MPTAIIFLNIGKSRIEQIVPTQIRLLLKEQSDQDLHCLPFHLHLLDALLHSKTKKMFYFRTMIVIILGVPKILEFFRH